MRSMQFGEQCGAARKHHDTAEDRKLQAIRDARYNQFVVLPLMQNPLTSSQNRC